MNYKTTPNTPRQCLIENAATLLAKAIVAARVEMTPHEFNQSTIAQYQYTNTQRTTTECVSAVLKMAETPERYEELNYYASFRGIADYWSTTTPRAIKMLAKAVEELALRKAERRLAWLLSRAESGQDEAKPYARIDPSIDEIFADYLGNEDIDPDDVENEIVFETDEDEDENGVILWYGVKMPVLQQRVLGMLAVYVKLHKQALTNEHNARLRCIALSVLHDAIQMDYEMLFDYEKATVEDALKKYPLPRLQGMVDSNDMSLIETVLRYVNPNLHNVVIEDTRRTDAYVYCTALAGLPDGPDGVTVRNITQGLCHQYLSPLDYALGEAKFQRGVYGTWDVLQTIVYDLGLNEVYTTRHIVDNVKVYA